MKTILNIIKDYPIAQKALKHIILTNTANNAPYHNLNHLLTVTKHAYNALRFNNNFYGGCMEDVLVACLFHDYGHSQGALPDSENVSIAKNALAEFNHKEQANLDLNFMFSLLNATQYPYIIPSEELDPYQKIIRDCDLCQIYEYDWLKQNIFGLSQEMNISVVDLIPKQRDFLSSIQPLSEYGKFMYDTHFEDVLNELIILQKLMDIRF
jgi:hypothetical protein